ncbi:hypothetical protein [Thermus aquaticus]|nr:hypothetical protein [Thermus aquaticus]
MLGRARRPTPRAEKEQGQDSPQVEGIPRQLAYLVGDGSGEEQI